MANLGLTDKPVVSLAEESLGVKDYMEALSNFIETCETPMTIAIQADWGAGKTSMMNLVKERLSEKNKKIETIWFNTWQFSQFDMGDDLPISLLSQFVKRLGGEDSKEIVKKLAGLTKKAGGMLAKVALGSAANELIDGGGKVVDSFFDNNLDVSEQIVKLKQDIEFIVEQKIDKDGNDRVVVFIDDLDRLVPEKAVELLEVMKLFLDISRCVFVLAVDYNVVIKGLEKKFGSSVDDLKGKSFFDKIIQLPFNLPVAQYDVSSYFKELLHGKFDYKEDDIETFVRLANSSVGFNPRSMKRLFNSLQLLKMVASSKNILDADSVATAEEKQRILFAILCLQTAYEPMYRFMLKHKSKINQSFFDIFQNLEVFKESEYYLEVKKEFNIQDDEDDKLIRFIEFFNIFYEAIQLDSDDSEDANENLSDKELENLMRFLSFSSITTSNTKGIDASSGTFQFKSIIHPFIREILMPRYQDLLEILQTEFKISSNNNSGEIFFTFKQGSMDFDCGVWRDAKNITFALNHNSGNKKTVKYWAERFMIDAYPNMIYNGRSKYGYLEFSVYKFTDDEMMQGEEAKMEIYKQIALKSFEEIIPKLATQYEDMQPIIKQTKGFVEKLIIQIRQNFSLKDGWHIEVNDALTLNMQEPINITHIDWKNDTFSISIEAGKSLFRSIYFGIRKKSAGYKFDESLVGDIFTLFDEKFDGGKSYNWWIYCKDLTKYADTVIGEPYYQKTGKYAYVDEISENEAISYIMKYLLTIKEQKEQLTELANAKIS